MSQREPLAPHRVIADRVRELRRRHGWSAQQLAEEMANVGVSWDRSIVANFETGRRKAVSVEELLALAYVLDVAPVHLLVPTEDDRDRYRITPSGTPVLPLDVVRGWIRGYKPVRRLTTGVIDARRYFAEIPATEHNPAIPRFTWVPASRAEAMEMRAALDEVIGREADAPGVDRFWPEEGDHAGR